MQPTMGRKNEYHRRVSPIVRRGGRSSDIHMPTINEKNTARPAMVMSRAMTRLPRHAAAAPAIHSATAISANMMKLFQSIVCFY